MDTGFVNESGSDRKGFAVVDLSIQFLFKSSESVVG
jgi:hypothetical protein